MVGGSDFRAIYLVAPHMYLTSTDACHVLVSTSYPRSHEMLGDVFLGVGIREQTYCILPLLSHHIRAMILIGQLQNIICKKCFDFISSSRGDILYDEASRENNIASKCSGGCLNLVRLVAITTNSGEPFRKLS